MAPCVLFSFSAFCSRARLRVTMESCRGSIVSRRGRGKRFRRRGLSSSFYWRRGGTLPRTNDSPTGISKVRFGIVFPQKSVNRIVVAGIFLSIFNLSESCVSPLATANTVHLVAPDGNVIKIPFVRVMTKRSFRSELCKKKSK